MFRESADNRLSSLELHDDKTTTNNRLLIPNVLVTHDSTQNMQRNINNDLNISNNDHGANLYVHCNVEPITRRLTSPSFMDTTCQRIKDWIAITKSPTAVNQNSVQRQNCLSAMNITETTPMLTKKNQNSVPSTISPIKNEKNLSTSKTPD